MKLKHLANIIDGREDQTVTIDEILDALSLSDEEKLIVEKRAALAGQLIKILTKYDLMMSQRSAAKVLGISPSRVNDLIHCRFEKFSLDALQAMVNRVGGRITMQVDTCGVDRRMKELLTELPAGARIKKQKQAIEKSKDHMSARSKVKDVQGNMLV